MNYLFGRTYVDDDDFHEDFERRLGSGLNERAQTGDAEALLEKAVARGLYQDDSGETLSMARAALGAAKGSGAELGRFNYALGLALEREEKWDEAATAYSEALNSGFGHSALNLGLLHMEDSQFGSAVRAWIRGRDEYADADCVAQLKQLETSPGVYEAEIELEDGSIDVVAFTEVPGGFGQMPSA